MSRLSKALALKELGFNYLGRDACGEFWGYAEKPVKEALDDGEFGVWYPYADDFTLSYELPTGLFPDISWTDEEATRVDDLIERCNHETAN